MAGAGRHQPLQRGDGAAALCPGGDAAGQRHGAAARPRQGRRLPARMGGEALRVDRRPPLPSGARLHQGPVPPLRPGVRSRAGQARGWPPRQQGDLRPRLRAAHPAGPPVRGAPGAPGGRGGGQAHPRSHCLRQGRARHAFRPAAARAARRRARACVGTRSGLLTMKWDLLCTNCRGAKFSTPTLSELPRGAHCPSCNIDYDRDFEKNVELSFAPAPTVRPLGVGGYCLSGPMATPHVAVQVLLAPGETRTIRVDLPAGPYRLRTLHPGDHVDIEHTGGPFPGLHITARGVEALPPGEAETITFRNDAGFELAAVIEDRTWAREALTAPEVISLQAFRDLFAAATLRPGDEAGVSQVALLFTDLQGSTALYERVGDAQAYNIVREHFALLAGIIRDHEGAVVKTIGDAVMASFDDPANAVKAALAMQASIGAKNLVLKLGVHAGASVVVNLNDRLDYFGSTVNMAARLQGQAQGGDIVLSRAIADDPAVRPLLQGVAAREESMPLKGFAQPISFVRLVPSCPAPSPS